MPRGIRADLAGDTKGYLFVTGDSGERSTKGEVLWNTICKCGTKNSYPTHQLTSGARTSCGCRGNKPAAPINEPFRYHIRRNKGKETLVTTSPEKKFKIISDYINGLTYPELAKKYKVKSTSIQEFVVALKDDINASFELRYLTNTGNLKKPLTSDTKAIISTTFIQDSLKDLLSAEDATTLTNEEMVFSWIYVNSGSSHVALKESGLADVLKKQTSVNLSLLGIYLREKPNVAGQIKALQDINIEKLAVSKEFVQSELIEQIHQLKELVSVDTKHLSARNSLLKTIELLGRTVSAFQDNIKVETVDPSKALDQLIELAQKPVESVYSIEDVTEDNEDN